MNALILFTLYASALAEFVGSLIDGPRWLKFIPDAASIAITAAVLLQGVRSGFAWVSAKYWVAFAAAAFIILAGILANSVGPGPIITGARFYLRAIPLFFAGAVLPLTDKQLRRQLALFLAISLLQVPVAAAQRYIVYSQGRFSGDSVAGTVGDSGILSILLICTVLVLLGFYLRGRLAARKFVPLFFLLLLPTTINETKATVLLLPLGLLATLVTGARPGRRLRALVTGVALTVAFGAILVPIYDFFQAGTPYKSERDLVGFFTNQAQVTAYMEHTKSKVELANTQDVRRGDAYRVAFDYVSRDPIELAFGLGVGNASRSSLGAEFAGKYADLFASFTDSSFTSFLLEIGLLGIAAVFVLYGLVLSDALAVAKADSGPLGALAVGWIGVVVVMAASTFYTNIHAYTSISYFYWYFSGLIAARRCELAFATRQARVARAPPRRKEVLGPAHCERSR